MSYQVLARKWRPRSFSEMVGQEHVLKALINALDHNRLHHAYLFTGTRGVGKTTVARILAKCLNCETGVGSTPCGVCDACVQIAQGRFVDLIEVDGASRTKVEDTRELLDNVQYSPTNARFKIYLIDEVHMLSNSSFNALLKTLEEPPEHVKFLLATTDPQKLPATILSRCLQFNLKNMSPEKIVSHLQYVLKEEIVPYEEAALWRLARSADGSMRDALSLTDQAIAFGNGQVNETDVSNMLGAIDQRFIADIVESLIVHDGVRVLGSVAKFAEHAPDYGSALDELQTLFHRIAIAQALPEALDNSYGDRSQILSYASKLAPEDVQLFYQMALIAKRDLHLNAVARNGFEMALLRMLAFKPQGVADVPTTDLPKSDVEEAQSSVKKPIPQDPEPSDSPSDKHTLLPDRDQADPAAELGKNGHDAGEDITGCSEPDPEEVTAELLDKNTSASKTEERPVVRSSVNLANKPESVVELAHSDLAQQSAGVTGAIESTPKKKIPLEEFTPSSWVELFQHIGLSGVLKMTASNLVCIRCEAHTLHFIQDENAGHFLNKEHAERLSMLLTDYFEEQVSADIRVAALPKENESPARYRDRKKKEQRSAALKGLQGDHVFLALEEAFGARLDESSLIIHESE